RRRMASITRAQLRSRSTPPDRSPLSPATTVLLVEELRRVPNRNPLALPRLRQEAYKIPGVHTCGRSTRGEKVRRVLILTADSGEELEVYYMLYRLREAGYEVDVAAAQRQRLPLLRHELQPGRG